MAPYTEPALSKRNETTDTGCCGGSAANTCAHTQRTLQI